MIREYIASNIRENVPSASVTHIKIVLNIPKKEYWSFIFKFSGR